MQKKVKKSDLEELQLGGESSLLSKIVPLFYPSIRTHSMEVSVEELTRFILLPLYSIIIIIKNNLFNQALRSDIFVYMSAIAGQTAGPNGRHFLIKP